MERRSASQVVTYAVDGTSPQWLGSLGHVSQLKYSYTCPGGPDQFSCLLQVPPDFRTEALNVGRIVGIYRGLSRVWEGHLDEPQYDMAGVTISGHGAGTYGSDFMASYSAWTNQNDAINQAISRGMSWSNPGLPSGVFLDQQQDPASIFITDLLNLYTSLGGLTWYVQRNNVLSVVPLPSAPTHVLVAASPVSRTTQGYVNTLYVRYASKLDDTGGVAQFGTAVCVQTAQVAKHGRIESYIDISNSGVKTNSQAQTVGFNLLSNYQRANWDGPFTIRQGELLTLGGTPCDIGAHGDQIMVCQLVVTDAPYGGEVVPGPISFIVGGYDYDDDAQTVQVTPFQSIRQSLDALMAAWVSDHQAPPLRKPPHVHHSPHGLHPRRHKKKHHHRHHKKHHRK